MKHCAFLSLIACMLLCGCGTTPSKGPLATKDDPNYIANSNASMRQSASGDMSAMKKQGDLAIIMNERAKKLYPAISKAIAPEPGKIIVAPQVTSLCPPEYPLAYRIFQTEAEVWVAFIIGPEGSVTEAKTLSEFESLFTKPALDAVKKWKFKPGSINGVPSSFLVSVPIRFQLEK